MFPNQDLPTFDETNLYIHEYLAKSYCWRSGFLPAGYEPYGNWQVSKAFVEAILSERHDPRVGIWMDQLRIDQSSEVDKRQSVAAMDITYRSCRRLVVLLEDVVLNGREISFVERQRAFGYPWEVWSLDEEDRKTLKT